MGSKMSFSLRASCDSGGFHDGFRWVQDVGGIVEIKLSLKACAKTCMGSVWDPNGFSILPGDPRGPLEAPGGGHQGLV